MPCICGSNSKYDCGCSEDSMCAWEEPILQKKRVYSEEDMNKLFNVFENKITTCFGEQNSSNRRWWEFSKDSIREEWLKQTQL